MKIANYHREAKGPTICVKCYNWDKDVPADAHGTGEQQRRAYDDTVSAWWDGAKEIAKRHGFNDVYSTGRMGGWLFTDPMPQPADDDSEPEYPAAFLAELETHLKRAPEMFADTLAGIIEDDATEAEARAAREAMPGRLAEALNKTLSLLDAHYNMTKNAPTAFIARNVRALLAEWEEMQ
jgi:hypothetical protein